ncbi:hypothetical protein Bbelb_299400 [Branchiostoma belcheri]|nr:hypothetical protein Bbelb_299400 [Branchiostoma belcheri]
MPRLGQETQRPNHYCQPRSLACYGSNNIAGILERVYNNKSTTNRRGRNTRGGATVRENPEGKGGQTRGRCPLGFDMMILIITLIILESLQQQIYHQQKG